MWTPISKTQLQDQILKTEPLLKSNLRTFWRLIKIEPEKWAEPTYGQEGGGFWVVAICGRRIIWYNDIEEGFNISTYSGYGYIDEYWCDQYALDEVVMQLFSLGIGRPSSTGRTLVGRSSPSAQPNKCVKVLGTFVSSVLCPCHQHLWSLGASQAERECLRVSVDTRHGSDT